MKNKVFKQRLEEWEYQVRDTGKEYLIANKNGNLMAIISKNIRKQINTNFAAWEELSDEKKDMLFDLFIHFTSTPPEDMEEEKKFYLRHKWENKKFTLKEIKEIKKKFDTDLADFELVEVEE